MFKKMIERLVGISLAITVSATSVIPVQAETTDNSKFDDFLTSEFVDYIENSDYLTAHYAVRYPENYGITMPDANDGFGDLFDADAESKVNTSLDTLHSFDYDSLSESQQHDYSVYETELNSELESIKYEDMTVIFDPSSGLQSNMITNLEEFVFYDQSDIDSYLTMITKVPAYFEEAIDFTKNQASTGYFMTDSALSDTLDEISDFTAKTDDYELIVSFDDSIDQFEGLTDEQRQSYKDKNSDLIQNTLIPAYQNLYDELSALKGSRSVTGGLSEYENGSEYYQTLVQSAGSTSMTVEEMVSLMETAITVAVEQYSSLYQQYGDAISSPSTIDMTDADETLNYLYNHMTTVPKGPTVNYTVSYLDQSIANPNIVAYYVNPPIDDYSNNVIKVNGDNVDDGTDLYQTLAHEGFPGHCYQITWYNSTNPNPLRTQISSSGYTEGWAMYAEELAMSTSGLDEMSQEMDNINNIIGYGEETLIDLGVNGLGWSKSQLTTELSSLGLNTEYAETYYNSVIDNPARVTSYGFGLAEMLEIRDKAETCLGSSFDEVSYNEVVLTYGPRNFELVEQDVDDYITENGGDPDSYKGWGQNTFHGFGDSGSSSSGSDSTQKKTQTKASDNTLTYVLIAGIAAAGIVAFVLLRKSHQNDPFKN